MTFSKRRVLVLVVVFAICGCLGYGCFVPRLSEDRLKREIDAALPMGTPRAEVEGWFSARGLKFHDIVEINEKPRQRRIIGLGTRIPDTGPRLDLFPAEIRLFFYFDEENKLKEKVIYEFVYMP